MAVLPAHTGTIPTGVQAARRLLICLCAGLFAGLHGGCVAPEPKDYSAFLEYMPQSILALPPLNESLDANAPYSYVTTVSQPLGEQGYYVFPVAVVDAFMRENGLPGPAEMHAVSPLRLKEIFGADAVLYVTLEEFGQKFELLSSTTRVRARAQLVDTASGVELWSGSVNHAEGSNTANQGLLGSLISAAISQVGSTVTDRSHDVARIANFRLIRDTGEGLLPGPRHPEFGVATEAPFPE